MVRTENYYSMSMKYSKDKYLMVFTFMVKIFLNLRRVFLTLQTKNIHNYVCFKKEITNVMLFPADFFTENKTTFVKINILCLLVYKV